MELLWLFLSQFGGVFVLVTSSKLLRDDRWILAGINSWLITISQLVFVLVITSAEYSIWVKFFIGGLGGSLGCMAAHLWYTKYLFKGKKEK